MSCFFTISLMDILSLIPHILKQAKAILIRILFGLPHYWTEVQLFCIPEGITRFTEKRKVKKKTHLTPWSMNVFVVCPLFVGTFCTSLYRRKKLYPMDIFVKKKWYYFHCLSIGNKKTWNITYNKQAGLPGDGVRNFKGYTEKGP